MGNGYGVISKNTRFSRDGHLVYKRKTLYIPDDNGRQDMLVGNGRNLTLHVWEHLNQKNKPSQLTILFPEFLRIVAY